MLFLDGELMDRVARDPLSAESPEIFGELCNLVETVRGDEPERAAQEFPLQDWIQFQLGHIVHQYRAIYAENSEYPRKLGAMRETG
jgi:hypothetical protein